MSGKGCPGWCMENSSGIDKGRGARLDACLFKLCMQPWRAAVRWEARASDIAEGWRGKVARSMPAC